MSQAISGLSVIPTNTDRNGTVTALNAIFKEYTRGTEGTVAMSGFGFVLETATDKASGCVISVTVLNAAISSYVDGTFDECQMTTPTTSQTSSLTSTPTTSPTRSPTTTLVYILLVYMLFFESDYFSNGLLCLNILTFFMHIVSLTHVNIQTKGYINTGTGVQTP